ncbi:MAG: sugar ABC transporter ATP-binding protein [Acidobacteria bacterium]|jgi:ABC-type sugar transport system ATPase subunit|nr:sugar ABC transporter ATP-binding protein [Acidobacteriota bacterium]
MLLQMKGVEKRFGGVTALRQGDLEIRAGEVHLVMGENGAGKSTMMKIIAGMQKRDGGAMIWQGQTVDFENPKQAAQMGIAMVHQESLLAPHLSVAENIFLGREIPGPLGTVNRRKMLAEATRLIAQYGFRLQADWMVGRLSPAGKQLVEICRAIQNGTSLLIFDEPTSSLSEAETHEVFRIVRELRERGTGVIYITHRMEELRSVGDRVTILRDGATVHTEELATLTRDRMIQCMVGRAVNAIYSREPVPPGERLLTVTGVSTPSLLRHVSLTLRAGEIVGLGGLMGAGRTELCRAIFGLDAVSSGTVEVDGRPLALRNPRQAVAAGIALIPEDRQRTGLARELPIGWNVTMANLEAVSPGGVIRHPEEERVTREAIDRLRIRCENGRQRAGRLSGGNQQKVVISKWVNRGARVFLFDEPTRGIDVGAKVEVFAVMDELARQGAAILMVSSELPELLQVADRILVMSQGHLVGELPRGCSQEDIMRLATAPPESGDLLQ